MPSLLGTPILADFDDRGGRKPRPVFIKTAERYCVAAFGRKVTSIERMWLSIWSRYVHVTTSGSTSNSALKWTAYRRLRRPDPLWRVAVPPEARATGWAFASGSASRLEILSMGTGAGSYLRPGWESGFRGGRDWALAPGPVVRPRGHHRGRSTRPRAAPSETAQGLGSAWASRSASVLGTASPFPVQRTEVPSRVRGRS